MLCFLFLTSCYIQEEYTESEKIIGNWIGGNKIVFFKDGSSSIYTSICESSTEFVLYEDGSLSFQDFVEKEINDGSIDFCELNTLTSQEGFWEILSPSKYRFALQNTSTGEDIIIEPFEVTLINNDVLTIRYKEFENEEDETISYFVYDYFRRYSN